VGAPYYDPEAAACSAANPCQVPFFGETGAPRYDDAIALEIQSVSTFSHGAVEVHALDINFIQLVINSLFSTPGENPMPLFTLGWAPDYPDPTDYIGAMVYPNATYTVSDAYNMFTVPANGHCENSATYSWSDLVYYANNPVNQTCQGAAFNVMTQAEYQAASELDLTERTLIYNLAEHISQKLALYIYFDQDTNVDKYAPWISGLSLDEQSTLGGGDSYPWFWVDGNGVVSG
jgi:hypothetical protein